MQRTFLDTNVLVYLFDNDAPAKKKTVSRLLQDGRDGQNLMLSTQVLQEFYVTVTRKLSEPLTFATAEQAVNDLTQLPVIGIDSTLVQTSIARSRRFGFSLWDSLIIEAALSGNADILLTEDLQHGQLIDSLRVENPFR